MVAGAVFRPPLLVGICEENSVLVWRGVGGSGPSLWYQIWSPCLVRARAIFGPLKCTNFEALSELPKQLCYTPGVPFYASKGGPQKCPPEMSYFHKRSLPQAG